MPLCLKFQRRDGLTQTVTSETDVRLTDDFRSFVDDLIITDHMVKQRLSQVVYREGERELMKRDYMLMMYSYGDERFRDIRYTYDDLKMFLTLKY